MEGINLNALRRPFYSLITIRAKKRKAFFCGKPPRGFVRPHFCPLLAQTCRFGAIDISLTSGVKRRQSAFYYYYSFSALALDWPGPKGEGRGDRKMLSVWMSFNKLKQQEMSKTSKNNITQGSDWIFSSNLNTFSWQFIWEVVVLSDKKQLYSTARQAQEGHSKAFSISGQQSLPALVLYSIVLSWQSRNTSPDRPSALAICSAGPNF